MKITPKYLLLSFATAAACVLSAQLFAETKLVILVTETDMRLAPDSPTRKELPPERPNHPMITIKKPARGESVPPIFDLKVKFESAVGASIDVRSVMVVYKDFIPITHRIRRHITTNGIDIKNARVPPGAHELTILVSDTEGRMSTSRLNFTVGS
jgi:hypothetical protein